MSKMYHRKTPTSVPPRPTIYNTPRIGEHEKKIQETTEPSQTITFLREAHVTEITLGNQKLRVMDAGHIQGVINMMDKHDSSIKQINKTISTLNRNIQTMHQQIQVLQREINDLKGKLNGNYL